MNVSLDAILVHPVHKQASKSHHNQMTLCCFVIMQFIEQKEQYCDVYLMMTSRGCYSGYPQIMFKWPQPNVPINIANRNRFLGYNNSI